MYLKRVSIIERVEKLQCDIQDVINSHNEIKYYAYILHDKDDTSPHYHIYLDFGNSGINTKNVAAWFGINEYRVNKIPSETKVTNIFLYFINGYFDQRNKYQYSLSDIVANFEIEQDIKKPKVLYNFDLYSYETQLEYVKTLPVSEQEKTLKILKRAYKEWCNLPL